MLCNNCFSNLGKDQSTVYNIDIQLHTRLTSCPCTVSCVHQVPRASTRTAPKQRNFEGHFVTALFVSLQLHGLHVNT